jgi:DNA-binding HxlR family transcriptional regulator
MRRRSVYFDGCPTAHALDLIGDRWALLIVRELMLGPKRFTDLRRGLPRISQNVLSQRLDDLESAEVLGRRTLPPPSASTVYELTERGRELETVLTALGRWGARSPSLPVSESLGIDTFVLGLRSLYQPGRRRPDRSYELRIDKDAFEFRISDGQLVIRRTAAEQPELILRVEPGLMSAVARGARPLADAISLTSDSPGDDVAGFVGLFRALEPVGAG